MTARLTAATREPFADFYARADAAETQLFDSLLASRVLMAAALAASGEHIPEDMRRTFERDAVAVEQMFTSFREKVRASSALAAAAEATRSLIEREVFEVGPALDDS